MSTALATRPEINQAVALVATDPKQLATLLEQLAALNEQHAAKPETDEKPVRSTMPSKMDENLAAALEKIPSVFQSVVPTRRAAISEANLQKLKEEKETLDAAVKALKARQDDIAKTLNTHFDVVAEQAGKVTPETSRRDAKGNYLYAYGDARQEAVMRGSQRMWTRETSAAKAEMSGQALEVAYRTKQISKAVYDSLTREVRVFDEALVAQQLAVATPPQREKLVEAISLITVRKPGTNSIHLRPVPKALKK